MSGAGQDRKCPPHSWTEIYRDPASGMVTEKCDDCGTTHTYQD